MIGDDDEAFRYMVVNAYNTTLINIECRNDRTCNNLTLLIVCFYIYMDVFDRI